MYNVIDLEVKRVIHIDTTEIKAEAWLKKYRKENKQPEIRYIVVEEYEADVLENDCFS